MMFYLIPGMKRMVEKEPKVFDSIAEVLEYYMPEPIYLGEDDFGEAAKRIVDEVLKKAKEDGHCVKDNPRRWKK